MADSVNGGNSPAKPPQEMSMEVRLLIAFLLMGAVMFLTPYLFKTQTPPPAKKDTNGQTASQTTGQPPVGPDGKPAAEAVTPAETPAISAAPVPGATPQKPLPPFLIETDLYKVAFSNQGATVRSWQLKKTTGN